MGVVRFPPDDLNDTVGWCRGLLTDLAGDGDSANEILDAVNSIKGGEASEWSMNYNVYGVELTPGGAVISFGWQDAERCRVALEMLARVVTEHLALLPPGDGVE